MPDATGLELLAQDLRESDAEAVLGTLHFRGKGVLIVEPAAVASPGAGTAVNVSGGQGDANA